MTTDSQKRQEHSGPLGVLYVLRQRLSIVLLCAALVPAGALVFSLLQEKQYTSSASLLFRDPQFDLKLFGSTVLTPSVDPEREAATNVQLVSLDVVAERTAERLGGGFTRDTVRNQVKVTPEGKSDVVSIEATNPSPSRAAKVANTFAEEYIAFRREADRSKIRGAQQLVDRELDRLTEQEKGGPRGRSLQDRSEQLNILASLQTGNAEVVQRGEVPGSPSSPQTTRNTVIGFVLGILLGVGLALLFERLDRRLRGASEIGEAFDRPVLGAIPDSRTLAKAEQDLQHLSPAEAESFRMLRANLRYFNVDRHIDSVLITSSAPADGKSTVALHLASAAASAGARVLLVEADLRHPTLANRLGLRADVGLSQVLAGEQPIEQVAYRVPVASNTKGNPGARTMDVLVCGPIPPNPTDLIESERMRQVIRQAEGRYDLVILDTPPTSVVSDAIPLVKEVSGVLVVCRLGKTTRESATSLRSQLENLNANTLGVVVNSIGRQRGYGYAYAYGYGYGDGRRPRRKRRDTERAEGTGQASWAGSAQAVPAETGSRQRESQEPSRAPQPPAAPGPPPNANDPSGQAAHQPSNGAGNSPPSGPMPAGADQSSSRLRPGRLKNRRQPRAPGS